MAHDELATEILDFLSPGARTYNDVLQALADRASPARIDATFQTLTAAGFVGRGASTADAAWLTVGGMEVLTEAHTTAAMPAAAIKAAVVGRAIRERTP